MVLAKAREQSVQELPKASKESPMADFFFLPMHRGPLLDEWGTRNREKQLRRIYRHDYNWMVQGAFAGLLKRVASTPWEIRGPENLSGTASKWWAERIKALGKVADSSRPDIEYYQELLRQADWGRGWTSFIKKGVDYLRQDGGWYWEIVAPGSPTGAPTAPPTMIAHLDSLRCFPTGDPEFPAVYTDRKGKLHLLPAGRVVHLVDMPDGDESRPGYGLCALARAASISGREILQGRYIESFLDDKPAPGIASVSGLTRAQRDKAFAAFREEQSRDEQTPWGKTLWMFGADPAIPLNINTTTFQQPPEKFDFKVYTEINVNALALAIGVDVQDLWQLSSGNMGSGAQSEILHQKSKGKALGDLYAQIERAINDILPEEYEFTFKARDEQEDMHEAQVAGQWTSAVSTARDDLQDNEARQILANNVPGFHDAITDEQGELIRVDDADVGAQDELPDAMLEQQELLKPGAQADDQSASDDVPTSQLSQDITAQTVQPMATETKPIAGEDAQDIKEVQAMLDAGLITIGAAQELMGQSPDPALAGLYLVDGVPVPRERVGDLWQSRFGRGIAGFDEVVSGDQRPDDENEKALDTSLGRRADADLGERTKAFQATRSAYVDNWTDLVRSGNDRSTPDRTRFGISARGQLRRHGLEGFRDGLEEGGVEDRELSDDDFDTFSTWLAEQSMFVTELSQRIYQTEEVVDPERSAEMWANKSLQRSFDLGRLSADANGLYEFFGPVVEKSCRHCRVLKGQRHRLKDYIRTGWLPKSDRLDCGGFNCVDQLVRIEGKARGRFPRG